MISVSENIFALLIMHDCVVVPDFGGFITHVIPSHYDEERNLYFPPQKRISFNRKLTQNDGLLAHHISIFNNISYSDALREIRNEVLGWNCQLTDNDVLQIPNIGSIKVGSENNWMFNPNSNQILYRNAFGMQAIPAQPIRKLSLQDQLPVSNVIGKSGIMVKVLAGIPLFLALSLIPLAITKQSYINTNAFKWSIPNSSITYQANSRDSLSFILDEMTDKKNALQLIYEKIEPKKEVIPEVNDTLKKDVIIEKPKEEKVKKSTIEKNRVYLIAGSFVEMWRAEKYINEMKQLNLTCQVLNTDNKIRVSIASYSAESEANTALASFRNQHPNIPVWLLKK